MIKIVLSLLKLIIILINTFYSRYSNEDNNPRFLDKLESELDAKMSEI